MTLTVINRNNDCRLILIRMFFMPGVRIVNPIFLIQIMGKGNTVMLYFYIFFLGGAEYLIRIRNK